MKWKNKGHEFDEIGQRFKNVDKVYIYGCGVRGTELAEKLSYCDCVTGFVDIRAASYPQGYIGKPVYPPHDFYKLEQKNSIIILCMDNPEVSKHLICYGFILGESLFDYYSFTGFYMYIFFLYRFGKLYAPSGMVLNNFITSSCTLKCKYCSALITSPLKTFEGHRCYSDIIKCADLLFGKIDFTDKYNLHGGETFLHPQLFDIIEYMLSNFLNQLNVLGISTNGFFPELDKKLLQILCNDKITITWTDYTIGGVTDNLIISQINKNINKLKSNGIKVVHNKPDYWYDYSHGKKRAEDNDGLQSVFNNCCNRCMYVYLNEFHSCGDGLLFYKLLGFKSMDYIDIETENNKAKYLEFMLGYTEKGYTDMCQYCGGGKHINNRKVIPGEQI